MAKYGSFDSNDGCPTVSEVQIASSDSVSFSNEKVINPSQSQTGSSWYSAVFLVVNACLGAGLLNFPHAFKESGGVFVAVGIQLILLVFIVIALITLAYCADKTGSSTYQDVVSRMCGHRVYVFCSFIMSFYCFGVCITFFTITGDQWDKFFSFVYGPLYCLKWYMNRKFIISITNIILVLPLCFPKRIDFLKYSSFLGFVAVLYCVLLVFVKYFTSHEPPGPVETRPSNWTDVFLVVPVICFSYQCHISVIPIYSCLKRRTIFEFGKVLFIAISLCVFAYTVTATFGYLTFGSFVNNDILVSYTPVDVYVLVAIILIAAKMYTTYPILLYVGRSSLTSVVSSVFGNSSSSPSNWYRRYLKIEHHLVTTLWFATSLLIAVFVPNIGVVISLLGGLAALFIFVFPGICLLNLSLNEFSVSKSSSVDTSNAVSRLLHRVQFILAFLFIVIGVFLFALTTVQAIMVNFVNKNTDLQPDNICL